jgi:hypothetical protein
MTSHPSPLGAMDVFADYLLLDPSATTSLARPGPDDTRVPSRLAQEPAAMSGATTFDPPVGDHADDLV